MRAISGMKAKFRQKMLIEAPKAMDGTIMGIFENTSKVVEAVAPQRFLAMRTAIGRLARIFNTVTIAPTRYERRRLCQYPCQTPTPATAWFNVPLKTALTIGKAINRDGIRTNAKNTNVVIESLAVLIFKSLSLLSTNGQILFTGIFNRDPSSRIPK